MAPQAGFRSGATLAMTEAATKAEMKTGTVALADLDLEISAAKKERGRIQPVSILRL